LIQLFRILLNDRVQKDGDPGAEEGKKLVNDAKKPPKRKWSGKKLFHLIITLCMIVRGSFFLLQPSFTHGDFPWHTSVLIIWIQAASMLFLLAYFNLLLFWAEFYYSVAGKTQKQVADTMRIPLLLFMLFIVAISATFLILSLLWLNDDILAEKLDMISSAVMSFLAVLVGCGFLSYGIRLYLLLRKYQLISPRKRAQTWKVVGVAVGCTICFLTRAGIVLYSLRQATQGFNKNFNAPWAVVFVFFFFLEVVPICLMLFLLRKLPNWKKGKPSLTR